MWSDNESDLDLLGCSHLVKAVAGVIADEQLLPATIGIFGDWGSGKSSLMKMVELELSEKKDSLVLSFNGWLFEGYEDAKSALMDTILDEILKNRPLDEKAKEQLKKLVKRVNWMRVLGLLAKGAVALKTGGLAALGFGAAAAATTPALGPEDAKGLIKEEEEEEVRRGIREFRKDFGKLLKAARIETLVVMIDDLDRCLPDTIIATLEAIKLFLFVPNTAFIVAADERLVRYAVRQRFPELPGERAEVGRDYLEKLIQYPIRIPSLGRPEMETYINLLFAKKAELVPGQFQAICKEVLSDSAERSLLEVRFNLGIARSVLGEGKVPEKFAEELGLAQRIAPVLASGLNGNPRQCKRFLNMLVMRIGMAKTRKVELKQRVLAKLMLLEYLKPQSFKLLAEAQAQQDGKPVEIRNAEAAHRFNLAAPARLAQAPSPEGSEPRKSPAAPRPSAVKSGPPSVAEELAPVVAPWLSDSWLDEWVGMEPPLGEEDLRPYFFFSRDSLGPIGGRVQRMSPVAQEIFIHLFQKSDAVRNNALKKAPQLSAADAASIFDALSEHVQQDENLGDPNSAFSRLCDWVKARLDQFGQFVAFLSTLPLGSLPIKAVTSLETLSENDPERLQKTKELLSRWAREASGPLKSAAKGRLAKLSAS